MFCPKCATQNLEGASFCRTCGANISLVPQALTGQIANAPDEEVDHRRRRRRGGKEATLDQAFKNAFMGLAFLLIAIVLSRLAIGQTWWFWMLLPAFSMMGTGIAQYIRVREKEKRTALQPPPVGRAFPERPRNVEGLMPQAPSVTEGTTRHLGVEAPTRHLDPSEHK
jgi:zinc ribbon protein